MDLSWTLVKLAVSSNWVQLAVSSGLALTGWCSIQHGDLPYLQYSVGVLKFEPSFLGGKGEGVWHLTGTCTIRCMKGTAQHLMGTIWYLTVKPTMEPRGVGGI